MVKHLLMVKRVTEQEEVRVISVRKKENTARNVIIKRIHTNHRRIRTMMKKRPYRINQAFQQQWIVMLRRKHKCWKVVQKQVPIMTAIMAYFSLRSVLLEDN